MPEHVGELREVKDRASGERTFVQILVDTTTYTLFKSAQQKAARENIGKMVKVTWEFTDDKQYKNVSGIVAAPNAAPKGGDGVASTGGGYSGTTKDERAVHDQHVSRQACLNTAVAIKSGGLDTEEVLALAGYLEGWVYRGQVEQPTEVTQTVTAAPEGDAKEQEKATKQRQAAVKPKRQDLPTDEVAAEQARVAELRGLCVKLGYNPDDDHDKVVISSLIKELAMGVPWTELTSEGQHNVLAELRKKEFWGTPKEGAKIDEQGQV